MEGIGKESGKEEIKGNDAKKPQKQQVSNWRHWHDVQIYEEECLVDGVLPPLLARNGSTKGEITKDEVEEEGEEATSRIKKNIKKSKKN
ncbi:hypothetical protein BDA96_03G207600 [Sorghum bicolor]|nr:hypothetical protein BDA96_03G207600 [Sorghum bicolor]